MVEVFFAYSHKDEEFRDELEIHLAMLRRQGLITAWHDRRIGAGKELHGEISAHLENAQVVLLLVSAYFLASDYCYDIEMNRALERHKNGQARVIPVVVHPCDWHSTSFGGLRATPPDGRPISKFANPHDAYLAVVQDIRHAVEELAPPKRSPSSTPPSPTRVDREAPGSRSSNLRVKRQFSDRERDKFLEDSFSYIANYFENSLAELANRNEEVEVAFKRIDANHFTAAIYIQGSKRSSCRVWRGDRAVGDIAYAAGDAGPANSFNEALRVEDDGYALLLKPLGMRLLASSAESLSQEGASEYLWSMLVEPMQ
jgi:hypothetical protein